MTDDPLPLASCSRSFGRHHSYPPRYGWLLKVHTALHDDPLVFDSPEASVILGVSSSMVPSMRFWANAFGLTAPSAAGGRAVEPTARANWLLDEDTGADPYLEDPRSLWLLHWWLLSPADCAVPSWYYLFARAGISRFTRAELRSHIHRAARESGWQPPSDDTIARDIACIATMYAPQVRSVDQPRAGIEDVLTNPFRDLNLVSTAGPQVQHRGDRTHEISVNRGAGRLAPTAVLLYTCLDYAAHCRSAPGSVALARLANGPGRIMLLDSGSLRGALERASARYPAVAVMESGTGEVLLTFADPPALLADLVLASTFRVPGGPGDS
ncbi:DUF4007 family protein [Kitasatospora sp. NPDC004240]